MFALKICGYPNLDTALAQFSPTHVISAITDMPALPGVGRHLRVNFHDVASPLDGYVHPQMNHIDQVFAFTADLVETDRLLIHCFAGQSRSTALAIGVLIQHGLAPDQAFDHVAAIRACLLPNQLIIRLIDQRLRLGGALERRIANHHEGFMLTPRHKPTNAPNAADVAWMRAMIGFVR